LSLEQSHLLSHAHFSAHFSFPQSAEANGTAASPSPNAMAETASKFLIMIKKSPSD
jgi:hypothetical protein